MKSINSLLLTLVLTISTGFCYPGNPSRNSEIKNSADLGLIVALYTMWDMDHDRILDHEDWSQAQQLYLEANPALEFSNCDINNDNQVDINEFRHAITKIDMEDLRGIFNEDPAQMSNSNVFEIWNLDNDRKIERFKYGAYVIELDDDHN